MTMILDLDYWSPRNLVEVEFEMNHVSNKLLSVGVTSAPPAPCHLWSRRVECTVCGAGN